MQKINIIAVGKLKEKFFIDAAKEYEKRLTNKVELKITEIAPQFLPENPTPAEIEKAKNAEGEKILKAIKSGKICALCIEGKSLSSEQFAELLLGSEVYNFVIGGSYGLSDEVKLRADIKLSFSAMTFPHKLFRIILLEQIYRATTINGNGKYHK